MQTTTKPDKKMETLSKKELLKKIEDYAAHLNLCILIDAKDDYDNSKEWWEILNSGATKPHKAYNATIRSNEGCAKYVSRYIKSGDVVKFYSGAFNIPSTEVEIA